MATLNDPEIMRDNGNVESPESAEPPKKNWKKYAIIGGVLAVAAIAAIVVAVTMTNNDEEITKSAGFELADALGDDYVPSSFNGSWGSGSGLLYYNHQGDIVILDPDLGNEQVLLPYDLEGIKDAADFVMSTDNQFIMLRFENEQRFRHSHESHYVAIEVMTKNRYNISLTGDLANVQMLKWAPFGNGMVFVENNNLFFKSSVLAAAVPISNVQNPRIYNGICDWVYEEEIFATNQAVWFSPSGKHVTYIQFDDTQVQRMNLPVYGEPGSIESQYPQERELDYPKPGTKNPTVRIFTVDLEQTTNTKLVQSEIKVPAQLANEDHIITQVVWRNNQDVVSMWTNRVQNYSVIQTCLQSTCKDVLEISQDHGWIEPNQRFLFNADGTQMAVLLYSAVNTWTTAQANKHTHITIVPIEGGGSQFAITSGLFNVQSLVKWDTSINRIFFIGNDERTPHYSHLYAVIPDNQHGNLKQCLTCNITTDGVNQTMFSVEFSRESQHLVLSILGPSIPRMEVYAYSLRSDGFIEMTPVHLLDNNQKIRDKISHIAEPTVSHFQVRLDETQLYTASVKMMAPANLDTSGKTKYPLLINVYGGPNLFLGTAEWSVGWGSYLASNKSVITVQIDGRSAGRRDDSSLFAGYRNLGTVEIEDQLKVAEYLGKNIPYIDGDRIGIWGWSYGGYAAAMTLAKDNSNLIKCAASVAPVTDWLYYDTMYTERFMGLLHENPSGYNESSLLGQVENLRDKSLFLIHGTLDDNVHYQQTMALARTLEVNDVPFTQMSYTDQNHRLPEVTMHLYHELNRFFGKCFNMELN